MSASKVEEGRAIRSLEKQIGLRVDRRIRQFRAFVCVCVYRRSLKCTLINDVVSNKFQRVSFKNNFVLINFARISLQKLIVQSKNFNTYFSYALHNNMINKYTILYS